MLKKLKKALVSLSLLSSRQSILQFMLFLTEAAYVSSTEEEIERL